MNGKQMCEVVVQAIKLDNPDANITPEQVWNMSPTGELYPVYESYQAALNKLRAYGVKPVNKEKE